ncbi:MAG: aspartyl protease family protein [Candidatus Melainabacteria bacterium]|nr:aspartyl protease family protein [Candidatus Melainabacteria bacterium]
MRLRRVIQTSLLALLPVVFVVCLEPGSAQSTSFDAGMKLYKAGQFGAAANKFLESVRTPGKEGAAYYYLGCCYYKLNRPLEARPIYRTVVNKYPTVHEAGLAAQMLHRLDPSFVIPVGIGDSPQSAGVSISAPPSVSSSAAALSGALSRSPGFPGEDFSKLPDEVRIPFTTDPSGHMRVTVYLENRPIEACFDTGANAHFGKNHLSAAGVALPRGNPNGQASGWAGAPVPVWRQTMRIKLGGLTRLAPVSIEEDLSMLPLVGQEFIQGYQCEVDNNSHYISLRKASAFKPSLSQVSSLYDVPCVRRGMRDYVKMFINGKELEVLVDTGAYASTFNAKDLADIGVRIPDDAPRTTASGVGGSFSLQTINVECRLGPIWKKDFPISVGGSAGSAVGQDFLGSQRFTIDREKNLMRFFH